MKIMEQLPTIGPVLWNRECYSLIHKAVLQKNNSRIEKLLSISPYSLETKTADKLKLTPLLVAASYGCEETFHFLLQLKAKVTAKSTRDFNAVQCALVHGQIKLVVSLLDHSEFRVFRDLFELLSVESLHTGELANTLEVLNLLVNSHITRGKEEGKSKSYEKRIESVNGITKLAALMDVCLKQEAMDDIALALLRVIESMSYSEHLFSLIVQNPIIEYQLKLTNAVGSSEAVSCLLQVTSTMVSRGYNDKIIALHAPKICLGAAKKTKDEIVMLNTISCLQQCTRNIEMIHYFHSDGILQDFVMVMHDSSPPIQSLIIQILTMVASIDESFRRVIFELKTIEKALEIMDKRQCSINYDIISLLYAMCMQQGDAEDAIKRSETATGILLHMIKNSIKADNQRKAFEILWLVAAEGTEEKRSLAGLVGPVSLVTMLSMALGNHQLTAITALCLLSPPLYGLQKEITSNAGIPLLLKVIYSTASPVIRSKALQVVENCSHDIALRPNTEVQRAVLSENGVQMMLRVQACAMETPVQLQSRCTLAAISIGSTKIKLQILTDPMFSLEDALSLSYESDSQLDEAKVLLAARTLCYLVYNHAETQKMITKKVPVKSLKHLLIWSSSKTKIEAAFYIIVLARVLDRSVNRVELLTFCIRHLVGTLQTALEEGDEKYQVQICTYVSALLPMKLEGICQAFVSMDLVSLLIKVIFKESQHCRKTSAIALNYITSDKTGARVILAYCRRYNELFHRIKTYSKGYTLDKDFVERWQHYKCNYLNHHKNTDKRRHVDRFPAVLGDGNGERKKSRLMEIRSEFKLPLINARKQLIVPLLRQH